MRGVLKSEEEPGAGTARKGGEIGGRAAVTVAWPEATGRQQGGAGAAARPTSRGFPGYEARGEPMNRSTFLCSLAGERGPLGCEASRNRRGEGVDVARGPLAPGSRIGRGLFTPTKRSLASELRQLSCSFRVAGHPPPPTSPFWEVRCFGGCPSVAHLSHADPYSRLAGPVSGTLEKLLETISLVRRRGNRLNRQLELKLPPELVLHPGLPAYASRCVGAITSRPIAPSTAPLPSPPHTFFARSPA